MIKSFIHKGLEDFFYDGTRKGIQAKHASKIEAILDRLDAANEIKDMNYPRLRPSSATSQKERAPGDKGLRQLAIDVSI